MQISLSRIIQVCPSCFWSHGQVTTYWCTMKVSALEFHPTSAQNCQWHPTKLHFSSVKIEPPQVHSTAAQSALKTRADCCIWRPSGLLFFIFLGNDADRSCVAALCISFIRRAPNRDAAACTQTGIKGARKFRTFRSKTQKCENGDFEEGKGCFCCVLGKSCIQLTSDG